MTTPSETTTPPKRRLSPICVILTLLGVCVPTAGWWFGQERLIAHSLQSTGVSVDPVPPLWPEKLSDVWDISSEWHARPESVELTDDVSDSARATARWITSFRYVQLRNLRLSQPDVRWFGHCRQLEYLEFLESDLRFVDLSQLKVNPGIFELKFWECELGEQTIPQLAQVPGIKSLLLSNADECRIRLQGLASFPKLRELHLGDMIIDATDLREIRKCPQLELLELDESVVTDACLQELAGCPRLRELRIRLRQADSQTVERARAVLSGVKVDGYRTMAGVF